MCKTNGKTMRINRYTTSMLATITIAVTSSSIGILTSITTTTITPMGV